MKKVLLAFAVLLGLVACTANKATSAEKSVVSSEVPFTVAEHYFFNKGQDIPVNPKITSEELFKQLFGMATVMGENGKPTEIDFSKQFVLAVVLPVTDINTEINPVKVEEKGDTLFYHYDVKTDEKQSFSIQPLSIIILDKKYENKEIFLINQQAMEDNMKEVQAYLKECGAFFIATVDGDQPRVRAFGVSEIIDGRLYIMTG
ncbi:MAG: hypothetical protein II431_07070, partial [Prevotella sp.]|nr:hypothetical protein [Prevotella sp.]